MRAIICREMRAIMTRLMRAIMTRLMRAIMTRLMRVIGTRLRTVAGMAEDDCYFRRGGHRRLLFGEMGLAVVFRGTPFVFQY